MRAGERLFVLFLIHLLFIHLVLVHFVLVGFVLVHLIFVGFIFVGFVLVGFIFVSFVLVDLRWRGRWGSVGLATCHPTFGVEGRQIQSGWLVFVVREPIRQEQGAT